MLKWLMNIVKLVKLVKTAREGYKKLTVTEKKFIKLCNDKDVEGAENLIKKGVDVNVRDKNSRTALMVAAAKGRLSVVQMLLRYVNDVNAKDYMDNTALILASDSRDEHPLTVEALIRAGADVNANNLNGVTALMRAEQHGHTRIIKILKDRGAV